MKQYKQYYYVKDSSQILSYHIMVNSNIAPKHFQLEIDKMHRLLKVKCEESGWDYTELTMYKFLKEDRRSDKTLPKGYKSFRYVFTLYRNIIKRTNEAGPYKSLKELR